MHLCAKVHALESANGVVTPLRSQLAAPRRPQVQLHTSSKKCQHSGRVEAETERTSSSACEKSAVGNTTGCPESHASSAKEVLYGEKRRRYLATNSIETVDQRVRRVRTPLVGGRLGSRASPRPRSLPRQRVL